MLSYLIEPEIDPVTVAELKSHLRIEHEIEDTYLQNLIRTATEYIENELQQALIQRTYVYECSKITAKDDLRFVQLPMGPVLEVLSVEQKKLDDARIGLRRYVLQDDRILLPSALMNPIIVTYRAGFGVYPKHIPAPIKQAILMVAGECYENRQGFSMQKSAFFQDLLSPYRRIRL